MSLSPSVSLSVSVYVCLPPLLFRCVCPSLHTRHPLTLAPLAQICVVESRVRLYMSVYVSAYVPFKSLCVSNVCMFEICVLVSRVRLYMYMCVDVYVYVNTLTHYTTRSSSGMSVSSPPPSPPEDPFPAMPPTFPPCFLFLFLFQARTPEGLVFCCPALGEDCVCVGMSE
jgi:hypothetical protein